MHTSYFANYWDIRKPVSISRQPPWWYVDAQFMALAPPWPLVRDAHAGRLTEHQYRLEYISTVLSKLDPAAVWREITGLHGEDCVLLCFEDLKHPGDFCHRRMVAQWFEDSLGVEVPEWIPPPKARSTLSF